MGGGMGGRMSGRMGAEWVAEWVAECRKTSVSDLRTPQRPPWGELPGKGRGRGRKADRHRRCITVETAQKEAGGGTEPEVPKVHQLRYTAGHPVTGPSDVCRNDEH